MDLFGALLGLGIGMVLIGLLKLLFFLLEMFLIWLSELICDLRFLKKRNAHRKRCGLRPLKRRDIDRMR
jgi:hypothetical protein